MGEDKAHEVVEVAVVVVVAVVAAAEMRPAMEI